MARRRRTDRILREFRERKYRLRGGKARTKRFIPDADSEFAHMAKQFAAHVAEHADRFGVAAEQVEELSCKVAAFRDALARSLHRDHAGPKATSKKNDARKDAEKVIRAVARFLRGLPEGTLDSVDRINLNMPERPKRAKRRTCPQIAPELRYVGSVDAQGRNAGGAGCAVKHILEYGNDFDCSSSAKPHGAVRLELFVELVPVGEAVPSHPGERSGGRLWYLRSYTTSRFEVAVPVMDDGTPMVVCYWGRWADSSGGFGPFSQTCVARVEGGPGIGPGSMYRGLPGAEHEQIRVTQVIGQIEGKVMVVGQRALPCDSVPMEALAEVPIPIE